MQTNQKKSPWRFFIKGYENDYDPPKIQASKGSWESFIPVEARRNYAQITPREAQSLTGIRTNQLPQTLGELGKQAKDGLDELYKEQSVQFIKGLIVNPKMNIIKDIKMAPMIIMPELEKEYLDKLNRKRLIS